MGGISLPRLLIGTNWFLGFSHTTRARDDMIKRTQGPKQIADILEVFLRAGINGMLGTRPEPKLQDAVKDAEDRVGLGMNHIGTPHFDLAGTPEANAANARTLEAYAEVGCAFCWPHQCTTDAMVNKQTRRIDGMDELCRKIREAGMIPGLSTHMPESPIYADETDLDVAGYIQIYNAAGFLMQIEIDWVHRSIWQRQKPVIAIKPLAAGRVPPLVGLAFSWATIRPIDMVCIGCYTPDEAREVIDISRSQLEGRPSGVELQTTRSKASVMAADG